VQRERFLAEIAARLGRPRLRLTPAREYHSPAPRLAALPTSELAERFARELEAVKGEVVLARSTREALASLASELGRARSIVAWERAELERLSGLELSGVWRELGQRCREPTAQDFDQAVLAADVGLTAVDAAIAETGTIMLSCGAGRPRAVSLSPRTHLALLRTRQLVARLGDAVAGLRQAPPSAVHFVTGPSRTSDIENDLSIGVHGPARVLVIVVPEESV
jgi:L-lactate dehydrogenase complex protein LldG